MEIEVNIIASKSMVKINDQVIENIDTLVLKIEEDLSVRLSVLANGAIKELELLANLK